jgi:hypothetical protein
MNRLVLVALIALSPAFGRTHRVNPCGAYADLLSTGHISVRVKLDTVARGDQWAIKEALAYWSTVLDLDVTVDNNLDTCNLEVVYGSGSTGPLASTIMPHYDGYDGTIRINTFNRVRPAALVAVLIHEIGHLMGLCHTRDRLSIMYYLVDTSQSVNSTRLAPADIEMAGRFHALRNQATSGILIAHK